jgi:hypothetical protein
MSSRLDQLHDYQRLDLLRRIVDHPEFNTMFNDIRSGLGEEMLLAPDAAKRDDIHAEARVLDRLRGRLTSLANEARALTVTPKEE